MTTNGNEKSKIQLAGEVARHLELETVALRSGTAQYLSDESGPPQTPKQLFFEPHYKASFTRVVDKKCLDVLVKMILSARENDNSGPERLRISCDLALRYSIEGEVELDDEQLRAFADLNALVNAYPYLREFVQSSTTRMGLPPLVLPLLKIVRPPPAKKAKANRTEE